MDLPLLHMLSMSICGDENIRRKAGIRIAAGPQMLRYRRSLRTDEHTCASYPQFEQIQYSTSFKRIPAPPPGQSCIREIDAITNFRFGGRGRATNYGP
jgi:hypothetical protein